MQYFNYFTKVEEHFRRARNSGLFMMSPLDWVLVESWKNAGVPLEAVFKGIDRSFVRYHSSKRRRYAQVNSVAFCAQEVLRAAQEMARGAPPVVAQQAPPGFEPGGLADFFRERCAQLRRVAEGARLGSEIFSEAAVALEDLAARADADGLGDLEAVERRLAAIEDRVAAATTLALAEDEVLAIRQELDAQLRPYRRKMSAEQIARLDQTYMRQRSLQALGVSRLSLFYVR